METLTRRGWLKFLGAIGVSSAAVRTGTAAAGGGQQPPTQSPRPADVFQQLTPVRRAINALRVINTVQARYYGSLGAYQPLESIPQYRSQADPILQQWMDLYTFTPDTPLLDGWSHGFSLHDSGAGYIVYLIEDATGHALKTDHTGVIREGTFQIAGDFRTFRGSPILPHERAVAQSKQREWLTGKLQGVLDFFFPTLQAQFYCCIFLCCSGYACQYGSPCGCNDIRGCCNLGGADCTWCCIQLADSGCGCCWTFC